MVLLVTAWYVPESRGTDTPAVSTCRAVLVAAGLGSVSWSLISAGDAGIGPSQLGLAGGLLAAVLVSNRIGEEAPACSPSTMLRDRRPTDPGVHADTAGLTAAWSA